jgi:hypothetical protein
MAGHWKGSATELDSGRTFDTVALIDAQGEAQWLLMRSNRDNDGFVLSGNVCCDSQFSDAMLGKELAETRTRDASIDTALAGGTMSGTLEFHDDEYRFALTASADYNRALTLQSLAGVYTRSTGSLFGEQITLTLTIDANGQLTGSYSNGCVFNGTASIPDTAHNMARLQIELANCGSQGSSKQWNGAYTGLGVLLLDSDAAGTDTFYHSAIGPTWFGPQSVRR